MYKIYYTLFDEIESALSGVPLHQKFIFMRGPKIIMSVMILNLNANDKVVNTFVDAFNSFLLEKRIETTIIEANGVSLLEYEPLSDSPIFEILVVVGHGNSCDKRNTSNLSMGFDDVEPFPGALNNLTILGQLLPNVNNPFFVLFACCDLLSAETLGSFDHHDNCSGIIATQERLSVDQARMVSDLVEYLLLVCQDSTDTTFFPTVINEFVKENPDSPAFRFFPSCRVVEEPN